MKKKSNNYFKLALSILLLLAIQVKAQQLRNVTSGFVANTFSGDNGKWVQNYAEELDVASDGTMVTASGWDEAGRCVGVFKDGQPIAYLKQFNGEGGHNCWGWGTSTEAVAINDNFLYVNNCDGDILLFNRSKNYFYESSVNSGVATGMTATANDVYLIKAGGIVQKRSVSNLGTVSLTFTVPGGYDLAVDKSGNIWILTDKNEVLKYSSAGVYSNTKIAEQSGWLPASVNYDAFNNLILVADNGPRRQVIKFNTAATQVGTFGDLGGISAGNKGTVGDLRFWKISGCGTDANGNIYVALNENGVSLRKFNANGIKQWEVQGMMFSDIASIDPASDGTDIYGINEHMKYDYQAQQWSLVSITNDRIKYPNDPRNDVAGTDITSALMRRVNGKLIMFTASMYGGGFDVYRFDGEIAVYCQTIDKLGWSGLPDKNGNIWYEANSNIKKIPLTGFTPEGAPIFGTEITVTTSLPSPFIEILRLEYDVDADVMYIGGYTNAKPDPMDGSWGLVGSTIARYPNWNKGQRVATHSVITAPDVSNYYPKAMSVAGDYIFVAGSRDRGKLYVYKSATMESVGTIESPTNMGEIGWIDMVYAVQAFKNSKGKYLVLTEDNSKGKNILYQWDGIVSTITVTSNSQSNGGENLFNLTDGDLYSKWLNLTATAWVQLSYNPTQIWNKYEITSGNDVPNRDPKNWTIQASNDGVNWTTLDSRTNQSWAERNDTKTYTFNNAKAYTYYKWDITANNGDIYLQSSELKFTGSTITAVENRNEQQTRLFPNPAKTELNLSGNLSENTNYEITSIERKSLQSGTFGGGSIPIESLQSGIYLIKIKTEAGEKIQRFVKE